MVKSAASLIGARGVNATSFSDVLAESGAPRGSIYHHFPDGKRQLTEEAVRWISDRVLAHQRGADGASAAEILECFIGMWRNVVVSSGASAGCVVAGVTVDTDASDHDVMTLVRSTFRAWIALLTKQLGAAGVPRERAGTIAATALAAMEGALILCRAEGNVKPLDAVAAEILRLVRTDTPPR